MWRQIFWKDGRTEVKQYTPFPSGTGDIIRSKIGSKRVDLILIRLAKCWNNFFSSKLCIWLYCENGKYMIILWKWQVYDYTVKISSRNIFFSPVQSNLFLQDSESKYFFRKKNIKLKLNSLRGKLIKKIARLKWFSHIPTKNEIKVWP